jgi:outer membrane protein assembly factor BamD
MRKIVLSAAFLLAASGCGGGPQIERLGPDGLFERALAELHAERWSEAIRAFERLTLEHPTHPRIQEARFRLGEAYMGRGEHITAAGEFARLASDFPNGPWADDARFKVCESYYELSPRAQLDQQYTRAAIEHCQSLIAYYPTSDYVPRAQELIVELREKLAEKAFLGGDFYFRRRAFDSAIIYFESVVAEYPGTATAPRALLRLAEVYQRLGYEEELLETQERLQREYPNSAEAQQVREVSLAGRS